MIALFDTNVLLDVLLEREPWLMDASELWKACDEGRLDGYVSADSITNIFYIVRRLKGKEKAIAAVGVCLKAFYVAPVFRETLEEAIKLRGGDFEDNVQIVCASGSSADVIVTGDTEGFRHSSIDVISPPQLLTRLAMAKH